MQRTQLTFVPGTTTVSSLVRNAADADVKGIEIEATLNPMEGLFLDFAYGLADSEFGLYCDLVASGPNGVPNAKCGAGEQDFSATRRLGNIPRHNISWGIQHSIPAPDFGFIAGSELSFRLNGYFQSETRIQNGTKKAAGDPGYHLLNMRVVLRDIELPGGLGSADFAIWGRNLTDENYRPFGIDFDSAGGGALPYVVQYFGERRTVGAELIWRFGTML
jgi:iron complex outermembrane receptor protein